MESNLNNIEMEVEKKEEEVDIHNIHRWNKVKEISAESISRVDRRLLYSKYFTDQIGLINQRSMLNRT